jgi:hypothetical protein
VHGVFARQALAALDPLGELLPSGRTACVEGLPPGALQQLRLTNCYLREFLARSHPLLGRAGPTCPFVPKALKLGSMRLAVIPGVPPAHQMAQLVKGFIRRFEATEPQRGPTAVYKALLLLFPDVPLSAAPEVIDGTQNALKEDFVARGARAAPPETPAVLWPWSHRLAGLMLGEFHMLNNSPGLHSASFFPLRTLCPSLAIRHMAPTDLVFLSADKYPAPKRAAFLRAYIERMGDKASDKTQKDVEHARRILAQLESDA